MTKLLLSFIAMGSMSAVVMAQKFTVTNENGNEIKYEVLSATEKTVAVTGRKDKLPNLVIPEKVEHNGERYTVTEIGSSAFDENPMMIKHSSLQTIEFPSTLQIIRDGAFERCDNIRSLVFPSGLSQIEAAAFAFCRHLESITFAEGLKVIGQGAFSYCDEITMLSFPIGLEKIEDRAFSYCYKIQSLSIPNSTRAIGRAVFPRGDYILENIPSIVNENSCERMGISKGSVTAYYAEHPRNGQQPQVVYVQTPNQSSQATPTVPEQPKPSSDVDVNIPTSSASNENTFAIIFANENYQEEVKVEYALNDGEVFKEYCQKVLGLPEDNVHLRKDATLNNMKAEMTWIQQVAKAYKGDVKFIVFYAGHGIPDEKSGVSYLLPVDGKGTMLETGYSLADFYQQLGELSAENITVFMDACFSGSKRGEGMLASARGIAIKAKPQAPKGKMVVFSAAQGDETAYPFKEKQHGLFTYYLLKKLKETQGNVSYAELGTYITDQVSRKSIVSNGKSQTPTVVPSVNMGEGWKSLKLK